MSQHVRMSQKILLAFMLCLSFSVRESYAIDFSEHHHINDNGYVVWNAEGDSDSEIYLYDGADIAKLTGNLNQGVNPRINNAYHVVWWKSNSGGCFISLTAFAL